MHFSLHLKQKALGEHDRFAAIQKARCISDANHAIERINGTTTSSSSAEEEKQQQQLKKGEEEGEEPMANDEEVVAALSGLMLGEEKEEEVVVPPPVDDDDDDDLPPRAKAAAAEAAAPPPPPPAPPAIVLPPRVGPMSPEEKHKRKCMAAVPTCMKARVWKSESLPEVGMLSSSSSSFAPDRLFTHSLTPLHVYIHTHR